MPLVLVASLTDTAFELDTGPLLDDMRRLVRCGMQARGSGKCDVGVRISP